MPLSRGRLAAAAGIALATLLACDEKPGAGCATDTDCAVGERCAGGSCEPVVAPPSAVCGDGILQPGEGCDLGAENSDDGTCDNLCRETRCGDGLVQSGRGEGCDDGPGNDDRFGACTTVCQPNSCGDGVVDQGESCDGGPGNSDRYGGCTERCAPPTCGDGVRSRRESCDSTGGCTPDCKLAGCGARSVVASDETTLVLLDDGRLLGAGRNREGELGVGLPGVLPALTELFPGVRFRSFRQQDVNGAGITTDGALVVWGDNSGGQLGRGHFMQLEGLVQLDPGPGWVDVAIGAYAVFALREDGSVWGVGMDLSRFPEATPMVPCWGNGWSCVMSLVPILQSGPGIVALAAGQEHLAVLDVEGHVLTWGCGPYGQLGDEVPEAEQGICTELGFPTGRACRRTPQMMAGQASPAVQVVAGWASTSWLDQDGRLFATGSNCASALGFGEERQYFAPQENRLLGEDGTTAHVVEISPGTSYFSTALDSNGQLWSFGSFGDVFDLGVPGPALRVPSPPGGATFELAVGVSHAIARAEDGRVFLAGQDTAGQLGDGEPLDTAHLEWRPLDLGRFCGCGNGSVEAAVGESCDDGPANGPDAACNPACQPQVCGDGFVGASSGEACDDGAANHDRFDACTTSCELSRCGDGVVDRGEGCDDGPGNSDQLGACTQRCTVPVCGDGVRSRGEACDGTPGCDADCTPSGSCAAAVAAGYGSTLVLLDDGRLVGFGDNGSGALGQPQAELAIPVPRELFAGAHFLRAKQGYVGGAGVLTSGALVSWGANWTGMRGTGDFVESEGLSLVDGAHRYVDVAVTDLETYGLRDDGAVVGFGFERTALLSGPGGVPSPVWSGTAYPSPIVVVPPGSGLVAIEAGVEHLVGLDGEGRVLTWGCGSWGALGTGLPLEELAACVDFEQPLSQDCRSSPAPIVGQLEPAVAIGATRAGTLWLDRRGNFLELGANCWGALGRDLWQPFDSPVTPPIPLAQRTLGPIHLVSLASGALHHGLVVADDGRLFGWGQNFGQLDPEWIDYIFAPRVLAPPPGGATLELSAGFAHVVALGASGRVFTSGRNTAGQLGLGSSGDEEQVGFAEVDLSAFCSP